LNVVAVKKVFGIHRPNNKKMAARRYSALA